jgi:type IV pilus assembly protein PilB
MKIIQELFAQAILSDKQKEDFEKEMSLTQKTEEELILEKNIITEEKLFEMKSKILNIPLRKVKPEDVSQDFLEIIPEEAEINYKMVPLFVKDKVVEVGMPYPENIPAQNALRFLARQENFEYKVFLITITNFKHILNQRKTLKEETKKAIEEIETVKKIKDIDTLEEKLAPKMLAEEAPIIKMVLVILRHAIENKASDIHIEPGRDKLNIRFRQDGILYSSLFLPLSVHSAVVTRIKIVAGLKIDETRVPQDGRFSAIINEKNVDFRVATFPILFGEKVVIRILDSGVGLRSFEDMGIRGRNLEVIKEAIKKPYGLILATGPTGSGKSTTLYSLLNILNQDSVNIVTLEDPIEYSIDGVNQSQVKPEIGYSFASGLRQILRQDPNVIMVGEIRDGETASLAINAALTGHVVLSTLHTNSSSGVVPRLIDLGVKSFLIPSTLRVAISQRLVRTLCNNCKVKTKPNEKISKYIAERIKIMPAYAREQIKDGENFVIYQTKGCEVCNFKGYVGRIGLYEVLAITPEIAEIIVKNPSEDQILKIAQKQGMLTMEQEGIIKVLKGETTIDEIERVTEEK